MRSFRSRLRDTRLAVTLAMPPLAKRSRALAMSTGLVRTGTPTASTERSGDGVVQLGRDGDARAVDATGERPVVGDGLDAERGRDGARARGIHVGDRDELGRRIGRVLLRVKPAEVSNPDDCGPEPRTTGQD